LFFCLNLCDLGGMI